MSKGYRCGEIGSYSGGDPKDASIAWKALEYEYREMGNHHILKDIAKFLDMPATGWNTVITEFRNRYGDSPGIWLTRKKKDAKELYSEYGELQSVKYDKKDIISDVGSDGIFVLRSQEHRENDEDDNKGKVVEEEAPVIDEEDAESYHGFLQPRPERKPRRRVEYVSRLDKLDSKQSSMKQLGED